MRNSRRRFSLFLGLLLLLLLLLSRFIVSKSMNGSGISFNWNSIRIEEIFCWKVVVVQLLLLFDIFGKDCLPFKAAILFFIQKEKNEETFHALLLLMLLMLLMLLLLLLLVFASRALIEWGFILLFSALFTRGFLILIFAFIDMH